MARIRRRNHGFTLLEGVIAAFILAIVMAAMFAAWSTCFNESANITEMTSAANICQAELGIAGVYGSANMPIGTYSTTTSQGTWTGAYIPATGWTSGATAYFSYSGAQLASSASAGVFFSLSVTVTDSSVLQGTGTSYTLAPTSLRSVVATCTRVSTGVVDFTMATNLVSGGL